MTDIVIPWVDASDQKWINKKKQWTLKEKSQQEQSEMDADERYRDYGTLKYLLRSIDQNMSWVENIFLITDDQVPNWLDTENKKIKIVAHTDYINREYLPTFNSNAIELNINHIENLHEQFILFNDDHIVNQTMNESDFFVDGKPKDFRIYEALLPQESFDHILLNNSQLINQLFYADRRRRKLKTVINRNYGKFMVRSILASYFPGVSGYYNPHSPQPLLKSTMDTLWSVAHDKVLETVSHHIRSEEDINIWTARYIQLETDNFVPTTPKRSAFYELDQVEAIQADLTEKKHQLLCINDTETDNYEKLTLSLKKHLEQAFPNKSQFEY